jgi:hypothetical protein
MSNGIRKGILSDELERQLRGRRVKTAVFTTFQLEPGFFEEDVLPLLFERSFSHVPRVRLIELEEALQAVDGVAVYYDRRGLRTSGASSSLDVRRIPLERGTGYFHPKLVLALVEEDGEEGEIIRALVVGVLSANLTRAGWWENVECAWIEEYEEGARCSIRHDLLEILRLIRGEEKTGEEHGALEAIYGFVRYNLRDEAFKSSDTVLHPRLFFGQQDLGPFFNERLGVSPDTYNLEVISPYFDDTDEAGALRELIDALKPKETRVFLPRGDDGAALCRGAFYEAVSALPGTKWGKLPRGIVSRAKQEETNQTERFVHAKFYRLWSRAAEREYYLLGSVNLTRAAHGRSNAGNLEVAVLVDHDYEGAPRFWLESIEDIPESFRVEKGEEEPADEAPPPLAVKYHWDRGESEYFWEGRAKPRSIRLAAGGVPVGRIQPVERGKWTRLSADVSEALADRLKSTSFLDVVVDKGVSGTILVQEEGMAKKPSILMTLTVEEILRYWSLLSTEQRQAFLAEKANAILVREGIVAARETKIETQDSLFDRFAGIFHAFSRLMEHVQNALENERENEAVYRLFGEKYDSLPSLVRKVLDQEDADPVNRYVTLLTAQDTLDRLERAHPEFFGDHRRELKELREQLGRGEAVKDALPLERFDDRERFLQWFERMFFTDMTPAEGAK